MKRKLTAAQTACIALLSTSFRKEGRRSAILQLPTGQGKCEVAIRVYKRLCKDWRLKLLLVTRNDKGLPQGWKTALGLGDHDELCPQKTVSLTRRGRPNLCRVTLGQLAKFLQRGKRPREDWQYWLIARNVFVVIDEFHHNKTLRRRLAEGLAGSGGDDGGLPKWMQVKPGRPAHGPLWLLVSATPYNPVQLDFQLDTGADANPDSDNLMKEEERERTVLVREVNETLAFAARLGDVRDARQQLDTYSKALRDAFERTDNDEDSGELPRLPRLPIKVVPLNMEAFGPRTTPRLRVRLPPQVPADTASAVRQVREVYRQIVAEKVPRTLSERLVLAGVRTRRDRLEGLEYGPSTVRGVRSAQLARGTIPPKLIALEMLAMALARQREKLLVFCTHRAVAVRVARHLKTIPELKEGGVEVATSGHLDDDEQKTKTIAERFCREERPNILVATDAFSESVDLHTCCSHVAHFELPWSPLRVLQRFGRLWRLKGGTAPVPVAVHFVHPASVEEEILNRLRRRWGYLKALGLGYLKLETAIGTRLPTVPW